MTKKFNEILENESFETVGPYQVIHSQDFRNEVICSHSIAEFREFMLGKLTFVDCDFVDINLGGTIIISCVFTNCNFTKTLFLKSELSNCNFNNCKISQSDLTKAEFTESSFRDCQFENVFMGGTFFNNCEFIEPKFDKVVALETVTFDKSKIWNSKKCIEVKASENVSNIINDLEN